MFSLSFLAIAAFLLSLLLTPLFRNLFRSVGLVDSPDQDRKRHARAVPRVGGIPILLAYAGACLLLLVMPLQGGELVHGAIPLARKLIPAVLVVFAVGLIDDLIGLKPWQKLAGESFAAGLAVWAGLHLTGLGHFQIGPVPAIVLTVFWLVVCTNAFNLIDGIDGLAAGIGLFATVTTFLAAMLHGHYPLALATAGLAGALLGFLVFNFNPASIFLGDSGSLSIGFLLGCYGIIWSQKTATLLGMTAPMMALAIPLLDTTLAVARRLLRGRPVFAADRGHIHHKLLERGLSPRRAALVLYGLCGLGAALSLLQSLASKQYAGPIVVLFCVAAWVGVERLGYVEFGLAGRLIVPATFRRVLGAQLRLRRLEEELAGAASTEECWEALRAAGKDFGFSHVALAVDHRCWEETLGEPGGHCWTLEIPLVEDGYVRLGHRFEGETVPMVVGPLAELVRRVLAGKLGNGKGAGADVCPTFVGQGSSTKPPRD